MSTDEFVKDGGDRTNWDDRTNSESARAIGFGRVSLARLAPYSAGVYSRARRTDWCAPRPAPALSRHARCVPRWSIVSTCPSRARQLDSFAKLGGGRNILTTGLCVAGRAAQYCGRIPPVGALARRAVGPKWHLLAHFPISSYLLAHFPICSVIRDMTEQIRGRDRTN